jgi:hypothetical protein
VAESRAAVAALATAQLGSPIAVIDHHGMISVTQFRSGVKVSTRYMDLQFYSSIFEPREDARRTIWKTHAVALSRTEPELVITAMGITRLEPFRELQDSKARGFVYELKLSNDHVPCFNVETTMLLEAVKLGSNGLRIDPLIDLSVALRPFALMGVEVALNHLVSNGYFGADRRRTLLAHLAS